MKVKHISVLLEFLNKELGEYTFYNDPKISHEGTGNEPGTEIFQVQFGPELENINDLRLMVGLDERIWVDRGVDEGIWEEVKTYNSSIKYLWQTLLWQL